MYDQISITLEIGAAAKLRENMPSLRPGALIWQLIFENRLVVEPAWLRQISRGFTCSMEIKTGTLLPSTFIYLHLN